MEQNFSSNGVGNVPPSSADFGNVRNDAERFRNVPKPSEDFGTVRKTAEIFGSFPKGSERNENHTLTVREVARMLQAAGVPRTERSITNWCQPNRSGIARLDAYYDPNEGRYLITPQSVELTIAEEKARAEKSIPDVSEMFGKVPKPSEAVPKQEAPVSEADASRIKELEREVYDLKLTNRGKDYFIEQLQEERKEFVEQLINASKRVGELETKLQLGSPKENQSSFNN